jgi:hypothetical protein
MRDGKVDASEEMRQGFGFEEMEAPERAREWFEGLFDRQPFTREAREFFRTLRLEVGDLSRELGGGFWWGDRSLVQVRGCQEEAALHELAHAFWHERRLEGNNARDFMDAVVKLADERDPRYARAATLAGHYVNGIPTQPDPSSPTGYWRGMLVEDNDWEMFAGLASGVMGDMQRLPTYVRQFYSGLFTTAERGED